jgi:predicted nucleic acid-binding protein
LATKKKVYWDSCLWIGLINEEPDKLDACRHVVDLARNGDVEIWTSTYTLAEVFKRKCENAQVGLPEDKDLVFEEFLNQDFVTYAQVDADVGRLARRLLRRYTELKKPTDAVHLATAIIHNCDEMHTTDQENLLPLNGRISRLDRNILLICRPPDPPPPPPPPPEDLFSQLQKLPDEDGVTPSSGSAGGIPELTDELALQLFALDAEAANRETFYDTRN